MKSCQLCVAEIRWWTEQLSVGIRRISYPGVRIVLETVRRACSGLGVGPGEHPGGGGGQGLAEGAAMAEDT